MTGEKEINKNPDDCRHRKNRDRGTDICCDLIARRITITFRIVYRIAIPVQILWIVRLRHKRIRRNKPADLLIVVSAAVIIDSCFVWEPWEPLGSGLHR